MKAICFSLLLAGINYLQAQTNTSNALDFDGNDDYVQLPNAHYFTKNKFTIEAWVYPRAYNSWSRVIDFSNGPGSDNVIMAVTDGPTGLPAGSIFRGGDGHNFTASTTLELNTWSHLAITVNGSTAKIYINGVLNVTDPNVLQVNDIQRTLNYIGKSPWADGYADMILDELKIWDGVLTADAIADNLHKKPTANQPGLLVYFDFNQGVQGGDNTSITTLVDKSGNDYHGTFHNFNLDGTGSNFVAGVELEEGASYTFVLEPVTIPSSLSACIASQVSINASVSYHATSYQWYKDSQPLSGETNSTLTLSSVVATSAGTYKVRVESPLGFNESNELQLTIDCNRALRFDGSDDYVEIPDADVLDVASEFTIEAWIKPADYNTTILSKSSDDVSGYKLWLSGDNKLVLTIDGLPEGQLVSYDAIPVSTWTHVAVSFKAGIEGGVKMYVNGLLNARATCSSNVSTNDFALRLGGYEGDDVLFNGDMDEVRIWNTALPGSSIAYNMKSKLAGNETSLVAYYDFDQGAADADNTVINVLTDKTTNANNGAFHGFALNGDGSNFVSQELGLAGTYAYQSAVVPSLPGANTRNVLMLNGRNQSIEATVSNFSGASGTYEVWVKKNNWNEFHDDVLFANGISHDASNSFYISLNGSVGLHFRYGGDSQTGNTYVAETPGVAEFHFGSSSWHHIAATWRYDQTTERTSLKLYVDGVQVGAGTASFILTSGTSFMIGYNPSSGYFGVGAIAEARLWNVAKTGTEIAAAMSSTLTGSETGLIAYWPFNEGSGSTLVNKVAGSGDGELMNKSITSWQSTSLPSALGSLWGMTVEGGTDGYGVLFKMAGNGTDLVVQKEFKKSAAGTSPYSDLTEWNNNKFFGMTRSGGANGSGVLFEYDLASGATVAKFAFGGANGAGPQGSLILGGNGKFYGTTYSGGTQDLGVLFEYDPGNGTYTKKIDFTGINGKNPRGRLSSGGNGKLYGVANGGTANSGVLFEYDPATDTFTKKYDFPGGTSGNGTAGGLTFVNGKLYGMTAAGGTSGVGTIFEYDIANETIAKKFDFAGGDGAYPGGYLTLGDNGKLYGLTSQGGTSGIGVLFEFDPGTYAYTKKVDFTGANGNNPNASVTLGANGMLYGMTYAGGSSSRGVLFEYNIATGDLITKVNFTGSNGRRPLYSSPVLGSNGKLYGMTSQGGDYNVGVIFEYEPVTGAYGRKVSFNAPDDGAYPQAGVMQASNGKMYGMTYSGGLTGAGTLFEFDPSNSTFTKKNDLDPQVNGRAYGNLTEAANGKLYGMTADGGPGSHGTLFAYDPANGKLTSKVNFIDVGVLNGYGSLTLVNGKLMGMSAFGGDNGSGVIFEFNPEDESFTKKFDFDHATGGYPYGSLTLANDKLYGMTSEGGDNGYGVIFEFNPEDGSYTKKFDFDYSTTGGYPYGDLTHVNNKLYGMTYQGGASDYGVLFEYDLATGSYAVVFDFDYTFGANPYGGLTLSGNGYLYGMTYTGGANEQGTVFEFNPATGSFVTRVDFTGSNGAYPVYSSLLYVKANQAITFGQLAAKTYGESSFDLSATSNSNLPVTFTSGNLNVATISGSTVTIVGAGTATITANQAGDGVYKAASPMEQSLVINKATLIAKADNKSKVYGAVNPSFTITYTGFVNGDDASNVTSPIASVASVSAGDQIIALNGGSSSNYDFTLQSGTLTVSKAPLTAKAENKSRVYGSANPALTISYTGFVNGEDKSSLTEPTIATTATTASDANTYPITLSGGAATNYALTLENGILTVDRAPLTAKAESKTKAYGAANPALIISYTGFVNGDSQSSITEPVITTTATTASGVGTYPITLSGGTTTNYAVILENGTLTVNRAVLTAKAEDKSRVYGAANPSLTISYAGFVNGENKSNITEPTLAVAATATSDAGTYPITLSGGAATNYSLTLQNGTLMVGKADQTISFSELTSRTIGDGALTLTATSSSGLPVVFASGNLHASVSGSSATLVSAGTATITASQAGSVNYNAAISVSRNFCINPAKPTVTKDFTNSSAPILTSSASEGNQWYKDGAVISGASTLKYTVASAGQYAVKVTVESCSSVLSDLVTVIVTEIANAEANELAAYPNPAVSQVEVRLPSAGEKQVEVISMDGKVMHQSGTSGNSITLEVGHYTSGMYLIKVISGAGSQSLRLVKK